jgi:N-sulfoglucosamine sulfohydrolase
MKSLALQEELRSKIFDNMKQSFFSHRQPNPFILLLVLFLCFSELSAQTKVSQRPNILWITTEDMSANLPSYGDSTIATPFLDRLSSESIRFTGMYSVSGVCAPSRSSLITGMYPSYMGTNHMRTASGDRGGLIAYEAVPPKEVKCFSEYLRAAGYYCTNNYKTDYQFGEPFTAWDESSREAHWRNRPKGKPFFAVFNIMRTHESQIWVHKNQPLRVDPAKIKLPVYYPESAVIRKDIARYYENIMVMDSIAAGVFKQLEEDGLLNNTIVFFFSDHGAGLPWYKREIYDRGLHVPFMVRFPDGMGAGSTDRELHSFVDIAPTVLSLAGVNIPEHLQGKPFLGNKKAGSDRPYIFAARDRLDEETDLVRAVRDQRFKYIRNFHPDKPYYMDLPFRNQMDLMNEIKRLRDEGKLNEIQKRWFETKPAEELYDTQTDPFELNNLAADTRYTAKREELRSALDQWLIDNRDKGFQSEKDLVEGMWPGLKQPLTEKPVRVEQKLSGNKRRLIISCPTAGASIGYKIGAEGSWLLYKEPLVLKAGQTVLAKAIRYGYMPSGEVSF